MIAADPEAAGGVGLHDFADIAHMYNEDLMHPSWRVGILGTSIADTKGGPVGSTVKYRIYRGQKIVVAIKWWGTVLPILSIHILLCLQNDPCLPYLEQSLNLVARVLSLLETNLNKLEVSPITKRAEFRLGE